MDHGYVHTVTETLAIVQLYELLHTVTTSTVTESVILSAQLSLAWLYSSSYMSCYKHRHLLNQYEGLNYSYELAATHTDS